MTELRIALAQIDTVVGDIAGNAERVREAAATAAAAGASLVVFPEMALTGYPAKDLLAFPGFIAECMAAATDLGRDLPLPCLVGIAEPVADGRLPPAHNSAILVGGGATQRTFRKTLLPTYDVFDEDRHFLPAAPQENHVFDLGGVRIGVTICEDMWNDPGLWPENRYIEDPIAEVVALGAQVIVNLSASPYSVGKPAVRQELAASHARRHGVPLLYCNLVGGNDDLVFDGSSFAVDARGDLAARGSLCTEDMLIVGVDVASGAVRGELRPCADGAVDEIRHALVLGLRDYAHKCGFTRAILGLSGGIDSALVAVLACEALGPGNVTGITMPSPYSSAGSIADSVRLAENLGMQCESVPIHGIFDAYLEALAPIFAGRAPDVTEENLQARIRGALLMAHSNKFGSLLLTTGNKSELAVGYCTLYGDMCGGLAVISDVYKHRVYELARSTNERAGREIVPVSTLEKAPSAELRPDQLDSDSLPPYEILDRILALYIEEGQDYRTIVSTSDLDAGLVADVLRMVDRNEYKRRQMPPGLRISSKSFGPGRRFPIAMRRRHR